MLKSISKMLKLMAFLTMIFPAAIGQGYQRSFKNQHNDSNSLENDQEYLLKQMNYQNIVESGDNEYNTSCKKITCDDVEDYPERQIKKEFLKNIILQTVQDEVGFRMNSLPQAHGPKPLMLESNKNIPVDILSDGSCQTNTKTTKLKQALTQQNSPVYVVYYPGFYTPKGVECRAPKFCLDSRTPVGHVNYCKTHIVIDEVYIYDKAHKIVTNKVLRTAGCNCKRIRMQQMRL